VGVLGDNSEFDDQRLKKKEYEILTRRQSQIVVIGSRAVEWGTSSIVI
jgi:hypothetical protein